MSVANIWRVCLLEQIYIFSVKASILYHEVYHERISNPASAYRKTVLERDLNVHDGSAAECFDKVPNSVVLRGWLICRHGLYFTHPRAFVNSSSSSPALKDQ